MGKRLKIPQRLRDHAVEHDIIEVLRDWGVGLDRADIILSGALLEAMLQKYNGDWALVAAAVQVWAQGLAVVEVVVAGDAVTKH